jgi:2-amino-4-hydroxy-6-hydroxymethyldihydropteridine diphosphokinase
MTAAWIGLGSNLDDPRRQVLDAIDEVDGLAETRLVRRSALYMSQPMGPQDQPDFINAVAVVETSLEPLDLLAALQGIELKHARRRERHWGPRTLDLDLLLYGDSVIDHPDLEVPHPGIAERSFVLLPLAEVSPGIGIPGIGTVEALLAALGNPSLEVTPDA